MVLGRGLGQLKEEQKKGVKRQQKGEKRKKKADILVSKNRG